MHGRCEQVIAEVDEECLEDSGRLLQEAASVVQQLQSGWHEERQGEIDELWSQCEAEYGFSLSREAPGAPALGSLRANAGCGAVGLLSGYTESCAMACSSAADASFPSELPAEAEAEADATAEAARLHDLEATRELRRSFEAKRAANSLEANVKAKGQVLTQRAALQTQADSRRLDTLRMEVEKLRARDSTANAASTELGDAASSSSEALLPPTPTASAAMTASALVAPSWVGALDEWMEDLRVLGIGAGEDLGSREQRRGQGASPARAVASPMRVRTANGARPSSSLLSPKKSPSKKEMARIAEQQALEWSAAGSPKGSSIGHGRGSLSPRSSSGQHSPSRRSPKAGSPKTALMTIGGLVGDGLPSGGVSPVLIPESNSSPTKEPASAVERQLDDILKELDEIDRIHDDVCMLKHS